MQRHFDEQIQGLLEKLVLMGRIAESMIQLALRILIERDESLSQEILRKENEVNDLQLEIDDRAVKLTALQQPVGSDVRFLFMASRIATELERIGDQAVNICQNAHYVLKSAPLKPLVDMPRMGELAENMVRKSIEALVNRNCETARAVLEEEKEVDLFRDPDLPSSSDLYDGGSRYDRTGVGFDPHVQEPGAGRRPCHKHRRGSNLPRGRAGSASSPGNEEQKLIAVDKKYAALRGDANAPRRERFTRPSYKTQSWRSGALGCNTHAYNRLLASSASSERSPFSRLMWLYKGCPLK